VWVVCYRLTHIRLIELIETIGKRDIEAVKQHLAAGADVNAKDEEGLTPLHLAASWGHKEVAELLIGKCADVNAKDIDGWTPLHDAAATGHKEITELLIAEGADVNETDGSGETPLDYAKGETADLLRKHGGKTGEELK
jgi:ankyrin repeat protein